MSKVIFVLGMHRSGTSVSTGILQALGVRLSDDLIPAAEENAQGYFESSVVSDVQEALLKAFGSQWWTSTTLQPLPANWWRLPAIAPYKQRLKEYVQAELAKSGGVWGFKDPRTARLLPMWNDIITELGVDADFVLVVRNPLEVAQSLHKRQKMTQAYAELLWLEHNADAAVYGASRLKAIIEYRGWFDEPADQATHLIQSLQLPMPTKQELETILAGLVSKDLRHHTDAGTAFEVPFTKDFYQALLSRDIGQLKLLSEVFNISRNFFTRLVTLHSNGKLQGTQ